MPETLPPKLYKYQSVSECSLDNLRKNVFYFNHPSAFNDPYDCSLVPVFDTSIIGIDDLFRNELLKDPKLPPEGRRHLLSGSCASALEASRRIIMVHMDTMREHLLNVVRPRIRVTCLTETNTNQLMWSHYANSGKGFCIGLDTSTSPFNGKLKKVNYANNIPKLDPLIANRDERKVVEEYIYILLATKSCDWSYENEWRLISLDDGLTTPYGPTALTGVYFGSECPDADMAAVSQAVKGSGSSPRFYKGKRSATKFEIEFDEIEAPQ
jgi:hypothetical protein